MNKEQTHWVYVGQCEASGAIDLQSFDAEYAEKCIFLVEQMTYGNKDWYWIFNQIVAEYIEERKEWKTWVKK